MSIETINLKKALNEMREKTVKRKFNQSIEIIINLKDVDMTNPESRIQEKIELPNSSGRKVNVCVFGDGDFSLRARRMGADIVLETPDIQNLMNDKKQQRKIAKNTDFFIASAPLMPLIGRSFGAILGPRGKMPTPVSPDANIEEELKKLQKMVFIRTRGQPVVQCRVGSEQMPDDAIIENVQSVLRNLVGKLKKGNNNLKSIYIKTTMGPPIRV